jgi:3-phenylpropionate/cinnamic acid dioxygenase small subunit
MSLAPPGAIDYKTLIQDDRIHASLYTDARVFDDEMERIFRRGWVFVGPEQHLSHIYDNRGRIETRIKLLQTGHRYSQEPASLMRRLISNIEVTAADNGELVAESNFALAELAIQAKRELHCWVGRTTHRLCRVNGELKMCRKKVVLVNAAEPLPNLLFLV